MPFSRFFHVSARSPSIIICYWYRKLRLFPNPRAPKEAPASMSRERSAAISPLHGLYRLGGELIALVYIAIIAEIACATGAVYVLFPELGALSHDVMTRPRGTWANAPAAARDHARADRHSRNHLHANAPIRLSLGPADGRRRDRDHPCPTLAGRTRDFRGPAAVSARREELVVPARDFARDDPARGAVLALEKILRHARSPGAARIKRRIPRGSF